METIKKKEDIEEIPLSAGTDVRTDLSMSISVAAPAEGSVSELSQLESPSAKQPLNSNVST